MTTNNISESSDEGITGSISPEPVAIVTAGSGTTGSPTIITSMDMETTPASNPDLIDLRVQLDRERGLRMILEDQVRSLESQLYPERIREITQQVQLQYQQREEVSILIVRFSPRHDIGVYCTSNVSLRPLFNV